MRCRRLAMTLLCLMVLPSITVAQSARESIMQLQKLNRFYRYLESVYVDSVAMAPLVESAMRSMLAELDPHSTYLNAEEMQSQRESFEGEFSGVGIEYNIHNDSIMVVNTVAGGPAERVGLMPNDRIVVIDGENVVGINRNDVSSKLRGPRGSVVAIGVARHGVDSLMDFSITRDNIPITTVDAAFLAADGVGYIKVNRFAGTTMREFREAMHSLGDVDALILDLCGNGGGLLDQAVEMAGYFLPPQALVVYNEGRAMRPEYYRAETGGEFSGSVVVLIDGNSASASEIVSGALQDWDRGVIVGNTSFGKGLVQRQIPMGDGSAVRLTVARYHTPTGRVIQRPYEKGQKAKYYNDYVERVTGQAKDSLTAERPVFETLQLKRKVYGGGGIEPDFVVKNDTTAVSDYLVKVVAQGVYADYMMEYMDAHRVQLEQLYPTFEEFSTSFVLSDEALQHFVAKATAKGVEFDKDGFERSKGLIRDQLTAMIAQRLFSTSEFYRLMNPRQSEYYKKALEVLSRRSADGTIGSMLKN